MDYLVLVIGLVALVFGANFFVEGASGIAKKLRVPALLIGLTIVAFGTSAPEVAVSVSASLKGNNGIAVGNVLGSNIFNAAFILGVAALILPLAVERQTIRKEIPIMILSSLALFALGADTVLSGAKEMYITRGDGVLLLILFAAFMYYIFEVAKNSRESVELLVDPMTERTGKLALMTLGGLALIVAGGNAVVESAVSIATAFGVSQTVIGITIVAIGTSLPELVTSVTASLKKNTEIAVGNVVGSNIFNVFLILGISSIINPLKIDSSILLDMVFNIVLSFILLGFSMSKSQINRKEGFLLLSLYIGYMGYLLINLV